MYIMTILVVEFQAWGFVVIMSFWTSNLEILLILTL